MISFYTRLKKRSRVFRNLIGINIENFDLILSKVTKAWDRNVIKQYKRPGRNYKLSLTDMLIMMLIYYRSYTSQLQIGLIFGLDESRVCRIIKLLEPLIAKIVAINKDRTLSYDEVKAIIIDVTEQPVERPRRKQRDYYSGKKRQHTLKTEIRIKDGGEICCVSKCFGGRTHDFKLHKQGDPLPHNTRIYADSGYQGLRKLRKFAATPYKKRRRKALTERQKQYNHILRRLRIKVEHTFSQLKKYHILANKYRNKHVGYNLKFNIIAGLVNINNGFYNKSCRTV